MIDHRQKQTIGFTLTELLIVVIIFSVLVSIALPAYMAQKRQAEYKGMKAQVRALVVAVQDYFYTTKAYEITTNTTDTNTHYGVSIHDGHFFNYTVVADPANATRYNIKVMYTQLSSGNPSTSNYTFDVNGTQIACTPFGSC